MRQRLFLQEASCKRLLSLFSFLISAVLIAVSFVISGRLPGIEGFRRLMRCAASLPLYTASARTPRRWEVAFYGGSFTAIPVDPGRPAAAGA